MTWLAYVLTAIAGIVDVAGYIVLGGIFTAHVSGDTVTAGVAFVHGNWTVAGILFGAVLLFVLGYLIGGSAIKLAILKRSAYWFSLGAAVEAIFLALFAGAHALFVGNAVSYVPAHWELIALMACLSFAMGTHNALLSNVENFPVRTTFVTGMTVNFARELLDWGFASLTGTPAGEHGRKARLYAAVWTSFAVGGCCGGYLLTVVGTQLFVLPSIAMAALAVHAWRHPFTRIEPEI